MIKMIITWRQIYACATDLKAVHMINTVSKLLTSVSTCLSAAYPASSQSLALSEDMVKTAGIRYLEAERSILALGFMSHSNIYKAV